MIEYDTSDVDGDFAEQLRKCGAYPLKAAGIDTLQMNITRKCNLSCKHCHVNAGPQRTEMMSRDILNQCIKASEHPSINTIDITGGVTSVRFTKETGVEDIRNAIDEVAENHLSDLRLWDISCEGINLTGRQIKQLAKYGRSKFLIPSKVAIVVQEDLAYGLMRMYEVYKNEGLSETRIFCSDQEARIWLNRPSDVSLVH